MSEPKGEPQPSSDAARVYEQLDFARAPVPAPLVPSGATPSPTRALALGSGAALLGALVYFGVRALTGYELGLIAIGVGIAVGVAVRIGAAGSTHRGYRILAIALAYVSVVATYIPMIVQSSRGDHGSAWTIFGATVAAFALPFVMLRYGEIMAVVILGIALWEAWKFSAPQITPPAPPAP